MDDLSMVVQEFYTELSARALKLGPAGNEFSVNEFLGRVEDFVCVRAHGILFLTRYVLLHPALPCSF